MLILGAVGQIARILRQRWIQEADASLVLFVRRGKWRIRIEDAQREVKVDDDFLDYDTLKEAMQSVDMIWRIRKDTNND